MAISRAREFEADRLGAEIAGDPRSLASALEKIQHYASGIPLHTTEAHPETAQMMIMNPLTGGSRGVPQGPAATDEAASRVLRGVFADIVVVRDGAARPPREILPLHAPGISTAPAAEDLPGLEPLEPGPTIAEVR